MGYRPISGAVPQYSRNASGDSADDYYLKFYQSGTTTPLSMATDSTGSTTLAKCALNSRGEPISNDADDTTVFIPHLNADYKLVLYPTATDADNNTTANAIFVVDSLSLDFTDENSVATYAAARALTSSSLSDNQVITITNSRYGGDFTVVTGTVTDDKTINIVFTDDSNRYLRRIYQGSVLTSWHEDVVGDGVSDDLTEVQAVLDAHDDVEVPVTMNHGFSDTLTITRDSVQLTVAGDLTRISTGTTPMIQVNASRCTLQSKGSSRVFGINDSPNGMVLLGPLDPSTAPDSNVLWNKIELNLAGNLGATSRGVTCYTTEGYGGSGSCYFNWIQNCLIENVEEGVYMMRNANGNMVRGVHFYRISGSCIHLNGTDGTGGSVSDCFASDISAHFSSSLNSVLKLQNANRNTFTNIGGEPGGGQLLDFDSSSSNNSFTGYDNTSTSSTDSGNNNVRIYNGFVRFNSTVGSGGFAYIEEGTYTPTITATGGGTITVNTASDLLSVTRLGRMINVHGNISVSSASSPSGDVRLSLPHTIDTDTEGEFSGTGTVNIANAAGNINAYGFLGGSNINYVTIRRTDGTSFSQCASDFSGNEVLYLNFWYRTSSSI